MTENEYTEMVEKFNELEKSFEAWYRNSAESISADLMNKCNDLEIKLKQSEDDKAAMDAAIQDLKDELSDAKVQISRLISVADRISRSLF